MSKCVWNRFYQLIFLYIRFFPQDITVNFNLVYLSILRIMDDYLCYKYE
jgi:hypothetical protein